LHSKRIVRRGYRLAVATGLAFAAMGATGPQSLADQSPYTGIGSASALRVMVADPEIIPLLQGGAIDANTGLAQAAADSFGGSQSLASLEYPGDDVAGLPGLIGALAPAGAPSIQLPAYPVTVKADSGTPQSSDSAGGYALSAQVGTGAAQAEAQGGVPGAIANQNLDATVVSAPTPGGGVKTVATSTVSALGYGSLIKLGTVTTEATTERTADGTLKREAHMTITGASILGLPLAISDNQLVVPVLGQLPVNAAIQQLPVLAALKTAGVTVEFEQAENTPNGIVAPAIKMTYPMALPALAIPAVDLPALIPGQPGVGPLPPSTVTVTAVFGNANAEATLTPLPTFPSIGTPNPPSGSGSSSSSGTGTGGGTGSTDTGSGSLDSGVSSGDTAPIAAGDQTPVSTGATPSTSAVPPVLAGYRVRAAYDALNIYLAIVVVGLIALGTGQLARFQGVKTTWKS
jgi:hypothetical protein